MEQGRLRPLIFGEVLFDHFPDNTSVLGGAPFNVAWNLHAFGLNPLMISRVGDDELGRKVETAMHDWGMDCSGLQKDFVHPTGTVEVHFEDGEPTYDIVDRVAYDFIDASQIPRLDAKWLLYHGSLSLRHESATAALAKLKDEYANGIFVDINLRPPWWRKKQVLDLIDGVDWIKLNEEELTEIYPEANDRTQRIEMLSDRITGQIFLTGGAQGATMISNANSNRISVTPGAALSVTDTVGAGDSFCSVLVAGLLLDWPLDVSMHRAQAFASAIVGIQGATIQDKGFYDRLIRDWDI